MLGYQAAHHRNPITNAIIGGDDFDLFDALNDGPVSAHFETLYGLYPNAVFVCTTRPLESWADSVRRHRLRIRGTDTPRDFDLIAAQEGADSAAHLPPADPRCHLAPPRSAQRPCGLGAARHGFLPRQTRCQIAPVQPVRRRWMAGALWIPGVRGARRGISPR